METIRQTFFQECEEQLNETETGLLALEIGEADSETVNAVFRAVHSIKGGAGAFKYERLVRFAHVFETALDGLRNGRLEASPSAMKTMLRSADLLADLVREARGDAAVDDARLEALRDELGRLAEEPGEPATQAADSFGFQPLTLSLGDLAPETPPSQGWRIVFRPAPDLYRRGNEPARILRELAELGDMRVTCDASALPLLDAFDPGGAYLAWSIDLTSAAPREKVEDAFDFVIDDCELRVAPLAPAPDAEAANADGLEFTPLSIDLPMIDAPTAPQAAASPPPTERKVETVRAEATVSQTIRVDLERVDRLANLVGELVINQAMLSQSIVEAALPRASKAFDDLTALEQLTREIQEGIMAIRAQPVKPLFQRMTRIVREVADATGKMVRLKTEGEATEVDRTVFEKLADPLTHLIRNAVDHGLETPDERAAAGKPEHGEVRLTAAHRSGRIVIDVSDDGKGIDRARVKAKAVEKDLIAADAQLSNTEIDNLLFLPGFSTAAAVSDISGRGVGMDVVKSSIQSLGGRISVSSRPGLGSTFSLSLPLTLAVLDGMVVKVAEQTLVAPLTTIVETLRPKARDVHRLGVDQRVLADRGVFVPLIDVGIEMGFRTTPADPLSGVVIIVEGDGGARCALMVDSILDQRQVVIKSLETNYQQVQGVAAATILGDGRVALILDIDAFVAVTHSQPPLAAVS
ncbi:chemotaxis protein CheA [Rhodoblastus acidophilus]|uniref:Chemotaxis protein CheA n=1 Tax=Rhodoblastus acidophilus TaxID=1074 RepID=A0A6N8DPT8_RHOAC|nr:chemotaxis protein CheA [Rhodoblastus acidophilus]MTV32479.1 chemotaxis protein CheA [Rhodoblastus acidophilus]